MKKHLFAKLFLGLILIGALTGCTAEAQVEFKENGSAEITFKGSAGEAFTKMVQSATGNTEIVFEDDQITMELTRSGFTDVNVTSNKSDLTVRACDPKCSTFMFTSGLFVKKSDGIRSDITRTTLSSFYSLADEQIVMLLDLLLAPVFNDEQMTSEEYLETLASFYGQPIADELKTSSLKLTIINNGKKSTQNIPLVDILCLAD